MLLHPLMLAWLAGATLPLILHLLSRSRYRAVPWGAMMFLTGEGAATHHAASLKQWILLLLRMAMVGLLAVAVARPVIAARFANVPTAGLTTGGPAACVIVLDDSASMGYEKDGKTRLDQAREVTLQILAALKRGDQASLLIAGARDYQQPTPPNADLQSIAAKVADLEPDIGTTDISNELLRAAELLDRAKPADHEIYVIADRQALSWRAVNDAFKQRWASRRSTAPPLHVTVIPVGGDEADNVAIEGFDLPEKAAFRDQVTDLQVRVHNFGPMQIDSLPLTVWSGTRTLGDATISIPARSMRVINFPLRFGETGSRVISAAVKTTGLTTDDRMDYAIDVLEPPVVLIASDRPATSQPVSQIQSALASGRRGVEPISISSAALNADALSKSGVVILDDVAQLTPPQIHALQQFVNAGGGVIMLPGDEVARQLKGNSIYQSGNELLPAMLMPPVSPVRPRQGLISSFERQNPIFRFVAIRPDPFANAPVHRFFPIGSKAGNVHTLARLASNDAYLMDFQEGKGHVILLTSPLEPDWTAWPQTNLLAQFMQSIVHYLGQTSSIDRNLWPGQAIVANIDEPIEDRTATVQFGVASNAPREPATVTRVNDHTEIRYGKTNKPGTYRLRYRADGKEKVLNYVVSANHNESDLTPLTDDQWRAMADRVGFDRVDLNKTTVAASIENRRGGREIWIDLIGGVLGLMLVEMVVSRLWSV